MIERLKRSLVVCYYLSREVSHALFGIQKNEGAGVATTKVAGFAARRIVYVLADYWLMGISVALVLGMKALDYNFLLTFLALWTFDLIVATTYMMIWHRTGIDLSLGEDFRRAADVIRAKSHIAGVMAFSLVIAQATFWSGPEQVAIFFQRELGSRERMFMVLLTLTGIQAAFWSAVYWLGYESAAELISYVSDRWTRP
jgi:hypothetical protein